MSTLFQAHKTVFFFLFSNKFSLPAFRFDLFLFHVAHQKHFNNDSETIEFAKRILYARYTVKNVFITFKIFLGRLTNKRQIIYKCSYKTCVYITRVESRRTIFQSFAFISGVCILLLLFPSFPSSSPLYLRVPRYNSSYYAVAVLITRIFTSSAITPDARDEQ